MTILETLYASALLCTHPINIALILLGTLIGFFFGIMPGLGGSVALALAIPFSYGMAPLQGMLLFSGIMGGIPFAGSITAILLNTPGTAVNAATTFDGYPMARQGEAGKAISISAMASGAGALFGVLVLLLLLPLVRGIVMLFGPPEFFWLVVFGLICVALAARGNFLKGIAAGGLGILISLVGYSDVFGVPRFTLGSQYLWDGISLVPFLVGLFAMSEMISLSFKGGSISGEILSVGKKNAHEALLALLNNKVNFLRSSAIGTGIGILPGVGGTVANFLSYLTAKQCSKNPELFGHGSVEGLIASESANNAKDGGSLLPTVAFGIPGSAEMAVLLGAFILHGLSPGPALLLHHLDVVLTLAVGLVISNVAVSLFGVIFSGKMARITTVKISYLIPVVIIFCFLGSYILRQNLWDVALMIIGGFLGYGMRKFGYSHVCLIIGFVLGILAETAFNQSLMMSYGNYSIFFTRPVALILFICMMAVLALPFLKGILRRRKNERIK